MKKINLCTMLLCIFFTSYHFYCSDSSLAQQHRSNVNVLNEEFLLQIHRFEKAIVENNQEKLDDTLQKNSALVHVCLPEHNLSPLELAIRTRSDNALDVLLAYKASVATIDSVSGDSLPHVAARYGNRYAVERSLEKGLPVDAKNNAGQIPVHLAGMSGDVELVNLLLQRDPATIDAQDGSGATVLHHAVSHNKVNVVKELMKRRPNVCLQDKHGNFALDYAISKNNPEIAQLILGIGNPYDSIMRAETILDLLNNSGRVSQGDLNIFVVRAICDGYGRMVDFLLKKGVDVNAKIRCDFVTSDWWEDWEDCEGTPLYYAIRVGNTAIVKALLNAGALVNEKDGSGRTLLHCAVNENKNRIAIIQALINGGADVNAKDQDGNAPLHYALARNEEAIIQALLDAGASMGERDRVGKNTSAEQR